MRYNEEYYNNIWNGILKKYTIDSPIYDLGDASRAYYVSYFLNMFLNSYCKNENITIADFGCGNWLYLGEIYKSIEAFNNTSSKKINFEIIGVDYSETAVKFGIEKYSCIKPDNVSVKINTGDVIEVANTISEKSVDLIISLETLEHLYKDKEFLRKACSLMKDDSRMLVSTPNVKPFVLSKNWYLYTLFRKQFSLKDEKVGHLRRYSLDDYIEIAKEFGLGIVDKKYYGFLFSDYLKMIVSFIEKHSESLMSRTHKLFTGFVIKENEFFNKIGSNKSEGLFVYFSN